MVIITNIYLNKKFENIEEYKKDLGLSIYIDDRYLNEKHFISNNFVIKDSIIKQYYNIFKNFINKMGKIGTLSFYIDTHLDKNDLIILDDDNNFYKFIFKENNNTRTYISDILRLVINKEVEPYNIKKQSKDTNKNLDKMTTKELIDYLKK